MKRPIIYPLLILALTVNGCRNTSDTQAKDPARSPMTVSGAGERISGNRAESPICLSANNLSIATGLPSLALISKSSTQIPVWSLSGGVFGNPLAWPVSEAVALGSVATVHAGDVNATAIRGMHALAFYSGESSDTAVLVSELAAPAAK